MPLYEYQCFSCGEEFEQIVRFSEADLLPPCPHCSGNNTHKKISVAASFGSGSSSTGSASASCGPGRFT